MSKRKNRKSRPDLPSDVLERARQQIAQESRPPAAEEADQEEQPAAPPKPAPTARPVSTAPVSSYRRTAERAARRRAEMGAAPGRKNGEQRTVLDVDYVRDKLAHPTIVVTEEQLRQQYSYVLDDLRRIGLLAIGLVAALIIIARFF